MKRLVHIFALCVASQTFTVGDLSAADCTAPRQIPEVTQIETPGPTGPRGPRGHRGHRGHKGRHGGRGHKGSHGDKGDDGSRGERGRRGATGATGATGPAGPTFEINDYIQATNTTNFSVDIPGYLRFISPIVYPVTGITGLGGLTLVESVPLSGNFDTITLPIEPQDTIYLVTYGASAGNESSPLLRLELNGVALPYTSLGFIGFPVILLSQTSLVRNPANIAGTLRVSVTAGSGSVDFQTPGPNDGSISAYITVTKLNNNAP